MLQDSMLVGMGHGTRTFERVDPVVEFRKPPDGRLYP
jgi:hypothetical protein